MLFRTTIIITAVVAGALAAIAGVTMAATPLLPNLQAQTAAQLQTNTDANGRIQLRFSTTTWNSGSGPLEVVGGPGDVVAGTQVVYQRIYDNAGSYVDVQAGEFVWHPTHGHVHFEDYARYALEPVDAPGTQAAISSKVSFCIIDTTRVKHGRSTSQPLYTSCGTTVQGMSAGWGDTYPYYLDGQSLDITDLADGDYRLVVTADPDDRLAETNDGDNSSSLLIRLQDGGVTVLEKARKNR